MATGDAGFIVPSYVERMDAPASADAPSNPQLRMLQNANEQQTDEDDARVLASSPTTLPAASRFQEVNPAAAGPGPANPRAPVNM